MAQAALSASPSLVDTALDALFEAAATDVGALDYTIDDALERRSRASLADAAESALVAVCQQALLRRPVSVALVHRVRVTRLPPLDEVRAQRRVDRRANLAGVGGEDWNRFDTPPSFWPLSARKDASVGPGAPRRAAKRAQRFAPLEVSRE